MSSYIFSNNYAQSGRYASYDYSSQNSSYPITNLFNFDRRAKVWRSGGYYEIPTGGYDIVFWETTSTNLTATVAAGEYTSFSSLATAIKTALDAAGDSTYTVSQDTTTLKAKIVSNGSGGGGIFTIVWPSSTEMADILGFSDDANDSGSLTYTADFLRINTGEWIEFDFGGEINPHAVVMTSLRNSPLKFSGSASIRIQGAYTNTWSTASYNEELSIVDNVAYKVKSTYSADGLHTEPLRYWRVLFDDKENTYGYIEIGQLFIGDGIDLTRGRVQIPFSADYIDSSVTIYSEGGQSITDEKEITESFSIDLLGLTKADKENFDYFFSSFKTVRPFFILLDSGSAVGTSAGKYLRLVKMTSAPSWEMPFPGFFGVSFSVREEL